MIYLNTLTYYKNFVKRNLNNYSNFIVNFLYFKQKTGR